MIWLLVIFLVAELFYFRIADRYNIIDKPNQRSSHTYITRRGGGIIFPVAWLVYSTYQGLHLPWFTLGLLTISTVSFLDDISEVGVFKRISLHTVSLCLAFYDLGIFNMLPWWGSVTCLIIALAALNAINFMDGINGITGLYALGFWISAALFAGQLFPGEMFSLASPLPYIMAALLVFGIFNFRKKAVCFAGDVGSVSMAYLMIGMTAFLIFRPEGTLFTDVSSLKYGSYAAGFELKYLLLLSVYGIDSFLTIVHRLILKENILKGHRKHLYQYMVNEFRLPHLAVAAAYALTQLAINSWVLNYEVDFLSAAVLLVAMVAFYVTAKLYIIQKSSQPVFQPEFTISSEPVTLPSIATLAVQEDADEEIPAVVASRKAIYENESQRRTETLQR